MTDEATTQVQTEAPKPTVKPTVDADTQLKLDVIKLIKYFKKAKPHIFN